MKKSIFFTLVVLLNLAICNIAYSLTKKEEAIAISALYNIIDDFVNNKGYLNDFGKFKEIGDNGRAYSTAEMKKRSTELSQAIENDADKDLIIEYLSTLGIDQKNNRDTLFSVWNAGMDENLLKSYNKANESAQKKNKCTAKCAELAYENKQLTSEKKLLINRSKRLEIVILDLEKKIKDMKVDMDVLDPTGVTSAKY